MGTGIYVITGISALLATFACSRVTLGLNNQSLPSKPRIETRKMLPDSAHGTNPATASIVGMDVVEIKSMIGG